MSSSEDAKEFLSDNYDGEPSDWKRISKRKHGTCDVRVFENKITGQVVKLNNFSGDDNFFTDEKIPKNFWIVLPEDIIQKLSTGILDDSYIAPVGENDDTVTGYVPGSLVIAMQGAQEPNSSLIWHDQHVSYLIQEYYGVVDFLKNFSEVTENTSVMVKGLSIKTVRDMMISKGLVFLGYYKIPWN